MDDMYALHFPSANAKFLSLVVYHFQPLPHPTNILRITTQHAVLHGDEPSFTILVRSRKDHHHHC